MQDALVTWLQSIPEVRKVNYSEMTANTLSGLNLLIAYVSMGIIVILLAVSIFLISNTVAIGISVRSAEINIMKYIGATDFFVRAPFVLEGMLIGLIGAAVPLGLIYSLYNYALNYVINRFMVLSGTQRGALPLLPEAVRVQAALACGADLVFALPAPCACAGAEAFARAGVRILAAAGCDALTGFALCGRMWYTVG